MRLTSLLFFLSLAALTCEAGATQSESKTILDGVYTTAQAARGEATFTRNCRGCHNTEALAGNTALPLKADLFIERWREDSLGSLFAKMSGFMPPPNVAPRLADDQYVDIISFLLQANAYPAGAQELKVDQLGSIEFVGKDGPQPLPNLAQVLVVGCLTPGPNDTWTLTRATEPVRARQPDSTNPAELKASDAKPLGAQTFQLRGFDGLSVSFDPDAHKGHKVQAKGVLNRQAAGSRINLLSMDVVNTSCAP